MATSRQLPSAWNDHQHPPKISGPSREIGTTTKENVKMFRYSVVFSIIYIFIVSFISEAQAQNCRPNPVGGYDCDNGMSSRPNPVGGMDYSNGVTSRPNPVGGMNYSNGVTSRPNPVGGMDYSNGVSCRPNPLGGMDCRR